jgi:hypothetical protein
MRKTKTKRKIIKKNKKNIKDKTLRKRKTSRKFIAGRVFDKTNTNYINDIPNKNIKYKTPLSYIIDTNYYRELVDLKGEKPSEFNDYGYLKLQPITQEDLEKMNSFRKNIKENNNEKIGGIGSNKNGVFTITPDYSSFSGVVKALEDWLSLNNGYLGIVIVSIDNQNDNTLLCSNNPVSRIRIEFSIFNAACIKDVSEQKEEEFSIRKLRDKGFIYFTMLYPEYNSDDLKELKNVNNNYDDFILKNNILDNDNLIDIINTKNNKKFNKVNFYSSNQSSLCYIKKSQNSNIEQFITNLKENLEIIQEDKDENNYKDEDEKKSIILNLKHITNDCVFDKIPEKTSKQRISYYFCSDEKGMSEMVFLNKKINPDDPTFHFKTNKSLITKNITEDMILSIKNTLNDLFTVDCITHHWDGLINQRLWRMTNSDDNIETSYMKTVVDDILYLSNPNLKCVQFIDFLGKKIINDNDKKILIYKEIDYKISYLKYLFYCKSRLTKTLNNEVVVTNYIEKKLNANTNKLSNILSNNPYHYNVVYRGMTNRYILSDPDKNGECTGIIRGMLHTTTNIGYAMNFALTDDSEMKKSCIYKIRFEAGIPYIAIDGKPYMSSKYGIYESEIIFPDNLLLTYNVKDIKAHSIKIKPDKNVTIDVIECYIKYIDAPHVDKFHKSFTEKKNRCFYMGNTIDEVSAFLDKQIGCKFDTSVQPANVII